MINKTVLNEANAKLLKIEFRNCILVKVSSIFCTFIARMTTTRGVAKNEVKIEMHLFKSIMKITWPWITLFNRKKVSKKIEKINSWEKGVPTLGDKVTRVCRSVNYHFVWTQSVARKLKTLEEIYPEELLFTKVSHFDMKLIEIQSFWQQLQIVCLCWIYCSTAAQKPSN